ncbi:MAG: outer membrane beta-barrel protein [Candidatus Omnitrophica bacterium]|nr:outer membrane beta-barrel protein [Candidatus Omnitrophota bacterium]
MKRITILIILLIMSIPHFAFSETQKLAPEKKERIVLALDQFEKGRTLAMQASFEEAQRKEAQEIAFDQGERASRLDELLRYWHPYLEVETKYEDNIFQTAARSSDIINTYIPGIKFESFKENNNFQINTGGKFTYYYHKWWNNTQNPFISFLWDKKLGRNYFILTEDFKYDTVNNSSLYAGTSGISGYQYNTFYLKAGRELNLFSIEPAVKRYDYFYRRDVKQSNSYNETVPTLTGYYKLAPKTSVLFEYNHGIVRYPKKPSPSKDNTYEQFWFGLNGDITSKIHGLMKGGYQFRKFNNGGNWQKPVLGLDLTYQLKERSQILLRLNKTATQSEYVNQNYYEINRLDLGLLHDFAFNSKLHLQLDSYYEYDNYPAPIDATLKKRLDNVYGVSGGLKYNLQRWFYALLKYEWKENNSNIHLDSYVDHIMSIKMVGTF